MKYCPTCNTLYEEDILRFCMKDGTPLLEAAEPSFTAIPSESLPEPEEIDDAAEVTLIRRNAPQLPPDPEDVFGPTVSGERIVIPTYPTQSPANQPIPPAAFPQMPIQPAYQPPPRPNTLAIVAFTMFGTVAAIALGALLIWFFVISRPGNSNLNANFNANAFSNFNANINSNLGISTSADYNSNPNNSNVNANFRVQTPTPSPTPSPTATPTPRPTPTATPNEIEPTPTPVVNIAPSTPRPSPTANSRPAAIPPSANANRP